MTTGIFPDQLKVAKVVPIFNKNDQSDIKNCQPISVLPTVSKLFENVMQTQLVEYFISHNLLANQQYGFGSNRSTELIAALEIMDRNCMNQNSCPINIYLGLSKAFDSLKYDILLSKLQYYGLQNKALLLLKSYLHERSQYVQIENVKSCSHPVYVVFHKVLYWVHYFSIFLLMTFLRQLQNLKLCMPMIQLWCHTLNIFVQ